jgi:hypothetical protein
LPKKAIHGNAPKGANADGLALTASSLGQRQWSFNIATASAPVTVGSMFIFSAPTSSPLAATSRGAVL